MKTIRDFLRKHALLLLAAIVVLSIPAGAAFGKYAQRVTVTDKLNLSVEMKTYKLVTGGSFKSAIAINCWNVKKIKFCNASYVKKELGEDSESYKCRDKNGNYVTVNENGSGNIYLYYDSNTGTAYVAPETDGTIYANENCEQMFYAYDTHGNNIPYSELTEIDFGNFNTSKVTKMESMFAFYPDDIKPKLKQLNLSKFDTSKVTTMSRMFSGQAELKSLDLSSFNTANVTDMSGMFGVCFNLKSITLGNGFNTSNVTTMRGMFSSCINLSSFPLDRLDTRNVTDMSFMFKATGFTELNLTNFDTSNVVKMNNMFDGHLEKDSRYGSGYSSRLESVDLSSFNTSNVTTMQRMFYEAENLKEIDLSKFNTEKVTDMSEMFYNCTGLKELDLASFNTLKVTTMRSMFSGCSNLVTIKVSDGFNVDNVAQGYLMFTGCSNLKGDKGTTYKRYNEINKEFAHIDGGTDNPGYFTDASGTSTTSTFSATGTDAAANGFGLALDLAS